jgi:hypothetical protein
MGRLVNIVSLAVAERQTTEIQLEGFFFFNIDNLLELLMSTKIFFADFMQLILQSI